MAWLQKNVLTILSGAVLALFAGLWTWIGIKLLVFNPSTTTPTLDLSDAQVTVAGFLASAVGAGTASVLGIEIQTVAQRELTMGAAQSPSLAAQVNTAIQGAPILMIGILVYAVVGAFVLVSWLVDSATASDVIGAFSLGVLGWLAGAFAAVFRKT